MKRDDSILEARVPTLDPWAGVAVIGLHSHTADSPCDDTCTVYNRTGGAA